VIAFVPAKLVRWGASEMQRREALAILAGAAVAWPLVGRAQQKAMPVIGFLNLGSPPVGPGPSPGREAFRQGLADTGYVEGQNVAAERRWAEDHYDQLPALAADLVARKVDVIVTAGTPGIRAATSATLTIPIVFRGGGDLVGAGLIASLARPGGNLTGVSVLAPELNPKRFDLLSELVPQARAIALLVNPYNQISEAQTREVQEAAGVKSLPLLS
jgi:putative ABC transport system substrate-binding protein